MANDDVTKAPVLQSQGAVVEDFNTTFHLLPVWPIYQPETSEPSWLSQIAAAAALVVGRGRAVAPDSAATAAVTADAAA